MPERSVLRSRDLEDLVVIRRETALAELQVLVLELLRAHRFEGHFVLIGFQEHRLEVLVLVGRTKNSLRHSFTLD